MLNVHLFSISLGPPPTEADRERFGGAADRIDDIRQELREAIHAMVHHATKPLSRPMIRYIGLSMRVNSVSVPADFTVADLELVVMFKKHQIAERQGHQTPYTQIVEETNYAIGCYVIDEVLDDEYTRKARTDYAKKEKEGA